MRLLCISDAQYVGHDKEIWSFSLFSPRTYDPQYNHRITLMDFERKFQFFSKPLKIIYEDCYV
jgi:hypothetical protein